MAAPEPVFGTTGATGDVGSEVNWVHRLWSSTNRLQAAVVFDDEDAIQSMFRDYVEMK